MLHYRGQAFVNFRDFIQDPPPGIISRAREALTLRYSDQAYGYFGGFVEMYTSLQALKRKQIRREG